MSSTTPLILSKPPDRDFWERDLLRGTYRQRVDLEGDPGGLERAVEERFRSRSSVEFIAACVGADTSGTVAEIQEELVAHGRAVIHFLLVDDFAQYKISAAVEDIAKVYLSEPELDACRRSTGKFDRQLLLMRLYLSEPTALLFVQGLNDWHRKGAAPMVLDGKVAAPTIDLGTYLVRKNILPVLSDIRKTHAAHPQVHYVMTVPRQHDGHLVFLRRNLRPDHVWTDDGTDVLHGQKSEWIILHFRDGARALKVCSQTSEVPREIASRIATAYFGQHVRYVDDLQAAPEAAIENFIAAIMDPEDGRLPILELSVANSPLTGGHKLLITNDGDRNIIDGIDDFEERVGPILDDLDGISRIKVAFGDTKRMNRISMFFPRKNGTRVVQYDDGRLDNNRCGAFEAYIADQFGITVRSTENKGGAR